MTRKKTNAFYGNKNTQHGENGYFCKIEFDSVATGEHIASMRREKKLSREKMVSELYEAELLCVSVTTLGRWERGEVKQMEAVQIESLCQFFQCSHYELVVYRY